MKVQFINSLTPREAAIAFLYEIMEQIENGYVQINDGEPRVVIHNVNGDCAVSFQIKYENAVPFVCTKRFQVGREYTLKTIRIYRNEFLSIMRGNNYCGGKR